MWCGWWPSGDGKVVCVYMKCTISDGLGNCVGVFFVTPPPPFPLLVWSRFFHFFIHSTGELDGALEQPDFDINVPTRI